MEAIRNYGPRVSGRGQVNVRKSGGGDGGQVPFGGGERPKRIVWSMTRRSRVDVISGEIAIWTELS